MLDSFYNFFSKTVTGAFSACLRPRLDESSGSSSDNDSDDEEPQKVITKYPTKKVKIGENSSLQDIWSCIDNGKKSHLKVRELLVPVINNAPKQKKEGSRLNIEETADEIPYRFQDLNFTDLNETICLKILRQEDGFYNINSFNVSVRQIKNKFHVMKKIIPVDADEYKEVRYSAKAYNILFGCLFNGKYYINCLDTAIEIYALAEYVGLKKLQHECNKIFAVERYGSYYTQNEVQNYIIESLDEHRYCEKNTPKCFVGYSRKVFCETDSSIYFPLYPVQLTLNEAFEKDIINKATFISGKGHLLILGFELKFNIDTENRKIPLNIIYKFRGKNFSIEDEIEDHLKPSLRIIFKRDDLRNKKRFPEQKQSGQIIELSIIVQNIKPRLCFGSLEAQYVQKTYYGEFQVSLTSSRKTDSNESLFFLKKVFASSTDYECQE